MSFAAGDPPFHPAPPVEAGFRPSFAYACSMMVASFLGWAVAGFQIVFVVPRFVKIFHDFYMLVTMGTQLVVDHGFWIVPSTMFATFLCCAFFRSRWMWFLLLIVVPVFVNLSIIANLYYPQMKLLEGLAK